VTHQRGGQGLRRSLQGVPRPSIFPSVTSCFKWDLGTRQTDAPTVAGSEHAVRPSRRGRGTHAILSGRIGTAGALSLRAMYGTPKKIHFHRRFLNNAIKTNRLVVEIKAISKANIAGKDYCRETRFLVFLASVIPFLTFQASSPHGLHTTHLATRSPRTASDTDALCSPCGAWHGGSSGHRVLISKYFPN